jgi:hypothetical protein
VWAQETGLAAYTGYGAAAARGKGGDDEQEASLSWQREAFSSRIDMVGLNLNLPVRPVLLRGADGIEGAKELLREAYRNEPLFRWLLGDVRSDNKGKQKENLLLEWLIDWRISSCWRYSHCLAIPQRIRPGQSATFGETGEQQPEVRGCAMVTYPGRCDSQTTLNPSAAQHLSITLRIPFSAYLVLLCLHGAVRESRLTTRNPQQARHRPLNEYVHVGRHATCRMWAWLQGAFCCARAHE